MAFMQLLLEGKSITYEKNAEEYDRIVNGPTRVDMPCIESLSFGLLKVEL
jgi:hypothetical protein